MQRTATPQPWNHLIAVGCAGLFACLATGAAAVHADVLDDIGYTQLVAELGGSLADGAGIQVSQIEAANSGNYGPDVGLSEFAGKSFEFLSGTTGVSMHATGMAQRFYGSTISTTPGISDIKLWEADEWLVDDYLKTNTSLEPLVETARVQNHSWVGSMSTQSVSINALMRLDYAIDRDGFTAVVGVDNPSEAGSALPELLSQSYNVISVGRSDGLHGHGLTYLDGSGRIKPELVAPEISSSRSTARVSSAAALLIDLAGSPVGKRPQTVKALLLAGATKDEFAGVWDRTITRPLDDTFGAGELNIYRSYQILEAGEQSASNTVPVSSTGWDWNQSLNGNRRYFFEVPVSYTLGELSAVLTWHREVVDSNAGSGFSPSHPTQELENLNLALYSSSDFSVDALLDRSISSVDNVEHIYLNADLGMGSPLQAGQYALQVSAPVSGVAYVLAWYARLDAVLGDMNLDGVVDFDDIAPFVLGLNDPDEYARVYEVLAVDHGDIDGDDEYDFDDISPFLDLLLSSQLVPSDSASEWRFGGGPPRSLVVAEPTTLGAVVGGLLSFAVAGMLRLRRGD
jgi:hypothetical protein